MKNKSLKLSSDDLWIDFYVWKSEFLKVENNGGRGSLKNKTQNIIRLTQRWKDTAISRHPALVAGGEKAEIIPV